MTVSLRHLKELRKPCALASLLHPVSVWVPRVEQGEEGSPTISSQPPPTDDPKGPGAGWEDRAQHPGPALRVAKLPFLAGTPGTTSRASRTRPASRSLRLCAQQRSPAAWRAPTRRESAPGDRGQAAHRPAGASRAGEPLAAPPPTCCSRGRFHLHLPLTLQPSRAPAPRRPAPGPPQPAHGPSAPRRPAPRPPGNTPPSPRPRPFAAREGHCCDRRGTLRPANCGCFRAKLALPTTAPRNQAVGGV